MNRRGILIGMAGLCGASLVQIAFGATEGAASTPAALGCSGADFTVDPIAKALKDDLNALGARQYSEEGVTVFLYCEDVVGEKTRAPKVPPNELSATIAAGLRDNGPAWKHLFPVGPAGDVNKLVEVLAVRDFNRDRLGHKS